MHNIKRKFELYKTFVISKTAHFENRYVACSKVRAVIEVVCCEFSHVVSSLLAQPVVKF